MKRRIQFSGWLPLALWVMAVGGLHAQLVIPPRHTLDPVIPQLLQMGQHESAVMADAELDPPVTTPGRPVLLRMVVTAHPESAAQPEKIPLPTGLSGHPGGTSTSLAINNLGLQFRTTYLYWITATQAGDYPIPAFTISANSQAVPVPSLTLRVVPEGSPELVRAPTLRVEVPPGATYYVGQKINLPVLVYDSGDGSVIGLTGIKGNGDGFVFDAGLGPQARTQREFQGRQVTALSDWLAVVPTRAGQLKLSAQAQVLCRTGRHLQSVFPGYQPLFESEPATVAVKNLPPGELLGFTGLIGHFTMAAPTLSATSVTAGDPVDLLVTVQGEGNLDRLVPPAFTGDTNWQVFPATRSGDSGAAITQRRSNTFRYTMIPLQAGRLMTPKIPFAYFDPDGRAYHDLSIPPVAVTVRPSPAAPLAHAESPAGSPANTDAPVAAGLPPAAVRAGHFVGRGGPISEQRGFWLAQLVPLIGFLGLVVWDERRRYWRAHPELVRRSRARRYFRLAREQMGQASNGMAYVRAAMSALREACALPMDAHPGALVAEDILRQLPVNMDRAQAEPVVRWLFAAWERQVYRGEGPTDEAIFARRAEVEQVVEQAGRNLC